MRTIYINPNTGDFELDGQNSLKMVEGDDAIRQGIWMILTTNLGEWDLEPDLGFARFNILGHKFNEDEAVSELTAAILQNEHVSAVEDVQMDFDRQARKLTINYRAIKSAGGEIEGAVEL